MILALILAAVAASDFAAVALDRDPARIVSTAFPESVRASPPKDEVVVPGPWRIASTVKGVRTWEAELPVRPRTLFFDRPPDGMQVRRTTAKGPAKMAFESGFPSWAVPNTWDFTTHAIRVRRRIDLGPPAEREYAVVYPEATQREDLLDPARSELAGAQLAFRSFQVDDTTRHGIYLPAPAAITLRLDVPAGRPVLEMSPGLLPTEAGDPRLASGVRLTVSIADDDVWSNRLELGTFARERVSLERWAGQTVELSFRTEAAEGAVFPYAFVADPIVFEPMEDPPRVVIVFLDTVRRDHLSIYGYERDTVPKLAAWAEDAAVFENARSVAPWTLPSARTMLTGVQPESYFHVPTLGALFAEKGWLSASIVGNVYLSNGSIFRMGEDWTLHRCINWPPAGIQVDRALEILEDAKDRPVFLQLHLMDAHLPYDEPWRYRKLFAEARPEAFESDSFLRNNVTRAKLGDKGKQYVRDRYDQTLRYMDDQVARVMRTLGPNDLVVVLADHGEEFWDHGGFEHGHTLFDELLRVPLIVKNGGVAAGRYDAPTSLLDVAPTIAAWAGLDARSMTGLALGTVAADRSAFDDRPQAFGRPLYTDRQWGVMKDGMKYVTKGYGEALRDLRADPAEQVDLLRTGADTLPWLGAMAAALGRPVPRSWRLIPTSKGGLSDDLVARLTVPGGIEARWEADVPLGAGDVTFASDATHLTVTWKAGKRGFRDVYVVPKEPIVDATQALEVTVCSGKKKATMEKPDDPAWPPDPAHAGSALLNARLDGITLSLGYGVAPEIDPEAGGVKAFDAEMKGALEALGYVDGSSGSEPTPPPTTEISDPCM